MPNNCNPLEWITPVWPAPCQVKALTTVRAGGTSLSPYSSFNLASHVGDDPSAVFENRSLLKNTACLPEEPLWLTQTHGIKVVDVNNSQPFVEADASVAFSANQVCAVLTADCLPILLCNKAGTAVSAIHAGWRGLAAGIIESSIDTLLARDIQTSELLAWLGPAIGPLAFEVKSDVLDAFKGFVSEETFQPQGDDRFLANIYNLARKRLEALGVRQIFGGNFCTYRDEARFYSFRRSGVTGRMATLIWFKPV